MLSVEQPINKFGDERYETYCCVNDYGVDHGAMFCTNNRAANLTVLKIMPGPTSTLEIVAYLSGGPIGIVTSMLVHPYMVRFLGNKKGVRHAFE